MSDPKAGTAFFDVDRTVVRVNTANLYLKWRYQRGETGKRQALRAIGWLLQYKLGVIDAEKVYASALRPLEGLEEDAFAEETRTWFNAMVRDQISDAAREEIKRRHDAGQTCALLTATTQYAAMPLAEELGVDEILCTRLEVIDGYLTGRFIPPLCYGEGKVALAQRWAQQRSVDLSRCAFFSDSISDVPMLESVGEPRVINPDPRLRVRAKAKGWPVAYWQ